MPKPYARVEELDILRAVAIIIIILAHTSTFLPTVTFSDFHLGIGVDVTYFGVALFLFISGFVLYLNHPSFTQLNGLTDFFKKRVLRIFPLYWLAIALRFVLGAQFASRAEAVVILLGLQGFLSPRFGADQNMLIWWFIGAIVVLYTIYPLIATLASDALQLPAPIDSDVVRFALMLIIPLIILVVARSFLFIIDDSVFVLYGIFVLGVAISKYDVLGKYGFLTDNRTTLLKYVAVAAIIFIVALFLYALFFFLFYLLNHSAYVSAASNFASYGLVFIAPTVLFLLFALLTFCLARIIVVSYSNASRPHSAAVWYRALLVIAFSSYAIFLFFVPILTQFMYALMGTQLTLLEIDIVQIFIGLPTVVVVAFVLQSTQNKILNRIKKYRAASSPSFDSNKLR
jgi:peptidoglycan/LPS O-acetylase OafA/YrhL